MSDSESTSAVADHVPARMVNEFVYCPRLAYLEWVQGEWDDNLDTIHAASPTPRATISRSFPLPCWRGSIEACQSSVLQCSTVAGFLSHAGEALLNGIVGANDPTATQHL